MAAGKTDLVMQVSPKGRLYQVYLGEKLQNAADYDQLKWDVYAASDGAVCQRGHEVCATSGAEDFFEPALAITHADGNMTLICISSRWSRSLWRVALRLSSLWPTRSIP